MGWMGTAVVGALALGCAVLLVRELRDDGTDPPSAAATPKPTPTAAPVPTAGRLPGVAAGDAALIAVSKAEAIRRCQLRWNRTTGRTMPQITNVFGPEPGDATFNAGEQIAVSPRHISYDDLNGLRHDDIFFCAIPGDLVPGKDDLAAAADDVVPTSEAAMLRRCSAVLWHDISTWRIVTSTFAGRTATAFVAVSPSGRYAAECRLVGRKLGDRHYYGGLMAAIAPAAPAPRTLREAPGELTHHYFGLVVDTCTTPGVPCLGQLYFEIHRVPRTVAKVRVESVRSTRTEPFDGTSELPVAGPSTAVPVKDGWLAVAWADGLRKPCRSARLTAYDARDRVVGVVSDRAGMIVGTC